MAQQTTTPTTPASAQTTAAPTQTAPAPSTETVGDKLIDFLNDPRIDPAKLKVTGKNVLGYPTGIVPDTQITFTIAKDAGLGTKFDVSQDPTYRALQSVSISPETVNIAGIPHPAVRIRNYPKFGMSHASIKAVYDDKEWFIMSETSTIYQRGADRTVTDIGTSEIHRRLAESNADIYGYQTQTFTFQELPDYLKLLGHTESDVIETAVPDELRVQRELPNLKDKITIPAGRWQ